MITKVERVSASPMTATDLRSPVEQPDGSPTT